MKYNIDNDLTDLSRSPLSEDLIIPVFQPIVSSGEGSIFGYEVLGRARVYTGDDKSAISEISLFHLFSDKRISTAEKLRVDRIIRRKALKQAAEQNYTGKLFFNIKPEWILDSREIIYPTVSFVEESGLKMDQIVIEITEDSFSGPIRELDDRIHGYRDAGFQIAIDDFEFHHIDRMLELQPDILKVDRSLVRDLALNTEYRSFVEYIAGFAADSGISVLFEGVENEAELEAALAAGSELLQGYYFQRPSDQIINDQDFSSIISPVRQKVFEMMESRVRFSLDVEQEMNELLARVTENLSKEKGNHPDQFDNFLRSLFSFLPEGCIRSYICNGSGVQLSSNLEITAEGIQLDSSFRGKDWKFRPFFLENLMRMLAYDRGYMSRTYIDSRKREKIRTFSYPIQGAFFLFVDVRA